MTTCLGKSCSFGLLCVPFVNFFMKMCVCVCVYVCVMCVSFPFFEDRMWDLIVLVLDKCLSFYFVFKCIKSA